MYTKPTIQPVHSLSNDFRQVDILRLDKIHPIVSGNKWYKLRFYIQEAIQNHATTIASFGGPFSNHLVALAFAAKENNLQSIGYVKANDGEPQTPSLQEALSYGMELIFLGRTFFNQEKNSILFKGENNAETKTYFVDEGGYGTLGAKGAASILESVKDHYDYIICAVGTGTMMAGLINGSTQQHIIGIPVLKNKDSIESEIKKLLENPNRDFTLLHDFHQGGYAKTSILQIDFMNQFWESESIPTDIVYTGKVILAVDQLIRSQYFHQGVKILIIHSGGLQGNRSLKEGVLKFHS